MFEELRFRYPFRKYQRMILDHIVQENKDNKFHIVAPPGSGKTIVGLELVRRLGKPAVIFAPTTTIQLQWREKLEMFTEDKAVVERLASVNPKDLRPINIYTYQLISAPENSRQMLREMAEKAWVQDLLDGNQAADEAAAWERLAALKANNPGRYRRERNRRALRIKRKLLREPDADVARFLHPNARKLIDDLVDYGVRTVVLDECHHLLDYWAIVLRYLISRIETPQIIGLTATLPSPDGDDEFENYDALVGEVDFEVPTPAVVKEGDLAPYRDLVLFVQPTRLEKEYLKNISQEFAAALDLITGRPAFCQWAEDVVQASTLEDWENAWNERPITMTAVIRWLLSQNWQPDHAYPIPQECYDPIQLDDWVTLAERYALDVLAISDDAEDHALLKRLRKVLYGFGFTLTESGLRQSRSPGDMVLTFSESKDRGAALILENEYAFLGDYIRAVVVTDFERMNSSVRRLKGILASDAGSAWRLFENLARNPRLEPLAPVLVTGRTVRCAAAHAETLISAINRNLAAEGSPVRCRGEIENEHVVRIIGEGSGWTPRVYVPILTDLFNEGVVKCLVGTRGILGEGWDAVRLNTLIDLTSVTTSTAVQQLRGRSLRKDPEWSRKVAHNWDVICIAPEFERGDIDFKRFRKRHARYWGLMLYPNVRKADFLHPYHGWVVKGIWHVMPNMYRWLHNLDRPNLNFQRYSGMERINRYMLSQIPMRDWVYEMWQVGAEYSNFTYRATQLQAANLKMRTVFTLEKTLKSMLYELFWALASSAVALFWVLNQPLLVSRVGMVLFLIVLVSIAGAFLLNLKKLRRTFVALFLEDRSDAILRDVALAALSALRDAGKVSRHLSNDFIRVVELDNFDYQVLVDYASPEDSHTFAQAVQQIFAPVTNQRYLILRTDERLPNWMVSPVWYLLRKLVRKFREQPPVYYPVPNVLASRKRDAKIFARYWEKYVGGGKLVYTRDEAGRRILLQARAQRKEKVDSLAFEFWR